MLKKSSRRLEDQQMLAGVRFFVRNVKLIEKEEILKDDTEIAEELNLFFYNAVKYLNIAETLASQTESLII